MPVNSKSNTLAIKPKIKVVRQKKSEVTKLKKPNSKSIAKAMKPEIKVANEKKSLATRFKKPTSKSNTLAIDQEKQESCKSIAKVIPENIQFTPQLKQNIVNVAQAAPGLMEMLDWYNKKHKNLIEIPELKINSKALGEAIITKTFKISEKAVKRFIEFAEKHPQFKHQDLLGTALIEFVERYHGF